MKKWLALLLALLLALPSGLAPAEETEEPSDSSLKTFSSLFSGLWDTIQKKADAAANTVTDKIQGVKETVSDKIQDAINIVAEKFPQVKDAVSEKLGNVKDAVSEKAGEIRQKLSDMTLEAVIRSLPEITDAILPLLPEDIRNQTEFILRTLSGMDPDELISHAKEALPEFWGNVKETASEKTAEVEDAVIAEGLRLLVRLLGIKPAYEDPATADALCPE